MREKGSPSIPIRPPMVLYAGLAVGGLLDYAADVRFLPDSLGFLSSLSGYALLAVSIGLMFMACTAFRREHTNVRTDRPAESVVADGIFRFTRNPMYLSFCLLGLSLSLILNSLWVLLGTFPFCVYIHHVVIPEEERYMEKRFGDAYLNYRRRTPRWL
ncbi:isoprenylcysteine carboxylmethyltransferase family protein [Dethiosulfovibrio sp. F2B]|uniref:methyltransferase family protein n=1 Tax=Dethiosulfovibrio faecalis TaxID=2720018 RepID=UPI001F16E47E|nr:isoprenylcysteine carboxylmethyltransferase family protein [Dethiosulfovibrio faecalis]MCF4150904.1 isoprenylcysteine carboxylmethyltransferase family protein [Dethiosulfovibrio faecalis]